MLKNSSATRRRFYTINYTMRFKTKPRIEIKRCWKFLYFPMIIGEETRWLERAHIKYELVVFTWVPIQFLNK